jgi:hypothetical protein
VDTTQSNHEIVVTVGSRFVLDIVNMFIKSFRRAESIHVEAVCAALQIAALLYKEGMVMV